MDAAAVISCDEPDDVTLTIPGRCYVVMRPDIARAIARALNLHAEQADILRDHPKRTAIGRRETVILT
jgi:hypothetical protein